jgi:hypothetical protein
MKLSTQAIASDASMFGTVRIFIILILVLVILLLYAFFLHQTGIKPELTMCHKVSHTSTPSQCSSVPHAALMEPLSSATTLDNLIVPNLEAEIVLCYSESLEQCCQQGVDGDVEDKQGNSKDKGVTACRDSPNIPPGTPVIW